MWKAHKKQLKLFEIIRSYSSKDFSSFHPNLPWHVCKCPRRFQWWCSWSRWFHSVFGERRAGRTWQQTGALKQRDHQWAKGIKAWGLWYRSAITKLKTHKRSSCRILLQCKRAPVSQSSLFFLLFLLILLNTAQEIPLFYQISARSFITLNRLCTHPKTSITGHTWQVNTFVTLF